MRHTRRWLMYWFMGAVGGNILYGVNVAADWLVRRTDRGMDYISDHTDHNHEEFRVK